MSKSMAVALTPELVKYLAEQKQTPNESYDMVLRRLLGLELKPGQKRRLKARIMADYALKHNAAAYERGFKSQDDVGPEALADSESPI